MIMRPLAGRAATACDLDFVRSQARLSFPDYEIDAVRSEPGIVTLAGCGKTRDRIDREAAPC